MEKSQAKLDLQLAPLRSLSDFCLESARFQIPNYKDLEKWGNRVTSNLLYYQTNYFLASLVIIMLFGVIHPLKMACGFMVTAVLFLVFCYIRMETDSGAQFIKKHPIVSLLLILSGGYFATYMLQLLLVFILGILLPISVTFIHASLRLRNLKNKLANKVEILGLKRTPMGVFLELLGLEIDLF